MSKKNNKNKYAPQRADTPPAQTAPAGQTPEPSGEQNRSFFSKIVSAVTEVGRTATKEERSVAAGLTASPSPETVELKAAWNEADLACRLWEAQLKRAQDEERKADAARRRSEEERSRLDARERQLKARRKEIKEQKKEQERLARDEAAKQKAEADALGAERRDCSPGRNCRTGSSS